MSLTDNCDADPAVSFVMSGSTNAGGLGTGGNTPMNLGVTQIVLTAKDACGNTSTCVYKVTVQDATPPTLLCPPDVSLTGSLSAGGAIAAWPPVIAIEDCDWASLVSDHASGDFFPCGVSLVRYIAMDQSGNTSICNFTVTVNCVDVCACGQFSNLTFSQHNSAPLPFKCGDFLSVTCPVIGSTLTLSGNFSCVGDTTCQPQNFQFVNSDGTPIGSG
ncbi:MAG TPA: HYR domain-containing protein, partial [Saprospiraceae bacterium]|nr:HYR domain-containing protein [Saprospiraceae bacterium]